MLTDTDDEFWYITGEELAELLALNTPHETSGLLRIFRSSTAAAVRELFGLTPGELAQQLNRGVIAESAAADAGRDVYDDRIAKGVE